MRRLLIAGFLGLAAFAAAQEAPGRMVDIGTHSLHLNCIGEEGVQVVVLEAGLGDWSLQLHDLQYRISEFARVCTYDRGGYGWSEAGPEPRTSEVLVQELADLLAASGETAPYTFVGHSIGGANLIALAHDHPELVRGLMLIDASHPEQVQRLAEVPAVLLLQDLEIEALRHMAVAAAAGEIEPDSILEIAPAGVPASMHELWADQFLHSGSLEAAIAEYDALSVSLPWLAERYELGDLPLVVVARGQGMSLPPEMLDALGIGQDDLDRSEEIWREMQEEHAGLSSNSQLKIATESPHYVHYFQPTIVTYLLPEVMN